MIQRYPTDPAIVDAFTSRQNEIKRLESEMRLMFGIWAKTKEVPDGATLMEASGNVLVVDEPEPEQADEQSN